MGRLTAPRHGSAERRARYIAHARKVLDLIEGATGPDYVYAQRQREHVAALERGEDVTVPAYLLGDDVDPTDPRRYVMHGDGSIEPVT